MVSLENRLATKHNMNVNKLQHQNRIQILREYNKKKRHELERQWHIGTIPETSSFKMAHLHVSSSH